MSMYFVLILVGFLFLVFFKSVKVVPQQSAWIIERLGRYDQLLQPGLNFLIPFVDRVAYRHSLKEYAHPVQEQSAITRDNVSLRIDGMLYLRVIDPKEASYGVSDPVYAVTQLAQTTMRSELGKLTMEETFEERERLNTNIVNAINIAAQTWGIQCMRYEIKDITPPASILKAMELQMTAERQKRAEILSSEGKRQSQINVAEADKAEVVLRSEASKIDQINRAEGEAAAILSVAQATAEGIRLVAASIKDQGGEEAVALKVADKYVDAFAKLAKESTTILLPANAADAGSMVAQALGVFDTIRQNRHPVNGPWVKS